MFQISGWFLVSSICLQILCMQDLRFYSSVTLLRVLARFLNPFAVNRRNRHSYALWLISNARIKLSSFLLQLATGDAGTIQIIQSRNTRAIDASNNRFASPDANSSLANLFCTFTRYTTTPLMFQFGVYSLES